MCSAPQKRGKAKQSAKSEPEPESEADEKKVEKGMLGMSMRPDKIERNRELKLKLKRMLERCCCTVGQEPLLPF